MPTIPTSSTVQDLHNFFRCCERLLASAQESGHLPFSQEEMKRICYPANQVAKLADYRKHIYPHHQDARSK